jgi:hypothetical protein
MRIIIEQKITCLPVNKTQPPDVHDWFSQVILLFCSKKYNQYVPISNMINTIFKSHPISINDQQYVWQNVYLFIYDNQCYINTNKNLYLDKITVIIVIYSEMFIAMHLFGLFFSCANINRIFFENEEKNEDNANNQQNSSGKRWRKKHMQIDFFSPYHLMYPIWRMRSTSTTNKLSYSFCSMLKWIISSPFFL